MAICTFTTRTFAARTFVTRTFATRTFAARTFAARRPSLFGTSDCHEERVQVLSPKLGRKILFIHVHTMSQKNMCVSVSVSVGVAYHCGPYVPGYGCMGGQRDSAS